VPAPIPFARGVPSTDLLPVDDLRAAAQEALRRDAAGALAYAPNGYGPLREWIGARHGVDPGRVLLVNGSLQGVGFLARHFFLGGAGRVEAVVEEPTYDRTITILRGYGAAIRTVGVGRDGLDVERLEEIVADGARPALVYVIPTYQNPSGATMPLAARRRLVELAREHDLLLVEDDPYSLLRFEGDPLPSLHELDGGERVVYCSSFTKTIAPGVRTGYLVMPQTLVAPFTRLSAETQIAPNSLAEAIISAYCDAGRFDPNVSRAAAALRGRRDAMEKALRAHFPPGSSWHTPTGGYFFWVELPGGIDAGAALPAAVEAGVAYVAGSDFCVSDGGGRSALRLAFSACGEDEIREGVARLGAVLAAERRPVALRIDRF
jgi:DNA-binding transcriptional MocR family regulator